MPYGGTYQSGCCWPPDMVTNSTQESLAEAKAKQDMLAVVDELDDLLEKFSQWKEMVAKHFLFCIQKNSG